MNLNNLKYTQDHEWIRIDGDIAYVGITDFAQGELGDIVYVENINSNILNIVLALFGTLLLALSAKISVASSII